MVPVAPTFLSVMPLIYFSSKRAFAIKGYFSENRLCKEIKGEAEQRRENFLITENVLEKKENDL